MCNKCDVEQLIEVAVENARKHLTISSVIKRVMPNGTRRGDAASWHDMPDLPTDVFAACGYLLQLSSAYKSFLPEYADSASGNTEVNLISSELKKWCEIGRKWRHSIEPPAEAVDSWRHLMDEYGVSAVFERGAREFRREVWLLVYKLVVIADEACDGMAFVDHSGPSGDTWTEKFIRAAYIRSARYKNVDGTSHLQNMTGGLTTLAPFSDPDVVCVQFKSRVSGVGCNLRVLTKNLALLPPQGIVRSRWIPSMAKGRGSDERVLNLLLIPYPFKISAMSFQASSSRGEINDGGVSLYPNRSGWFEMKASWCSDEGLENFLKFVSDLIEIAESDCGTVHGLIFPEGALKWEYISKLTKHLLDKHQEIEFFVSGSIDNCNATSGNFAISVEFYVNAEGERKALVVSRAKHHRWRLDRSQIESYGLASSLDPRVLWWEKTPILRREVIVNIFRERSIFATMICEDLASSDPCHETIRAIGPNIVFVLLMDGPQIVSRWPGRYATALADDPGSAVLTLTSLGLVARSNDGRGKEKNWSIGLWKDDSGTIREILCGPESQGVVLSLSATLVKDQTLCGRANCMAKSWRFHHQKAIKVNG